MSRPSIDGNKIKTNKLWMEIYRSNDPAGKVNIEVWNAWNKYITSNQVLASLPIKVVAKAISRPWPEEIQEDTLSDHLSFLNILNHKRDLQKTIILSIATIAIGYMGNKPCDYAVTSSENTFLHILGDKPVSKLLTPESWKCWQNTINMSRLMEMHIHDLADYIGIIAPPELAKAKIANIIKMSLQELRSKYTTQSVEIITICLSVLSIIVKLNTKYDAASSNNSTDFASFILEHHDTLKDIFAK